MSCSRTHHSDTGEALTPSSLVKHSTTEPLLSLQSVVYIEVSQLTMSKKIEFLYLKIDFASANSTDPAPGDMHLAVNVPVMTVHQGLSSLPR